MASNVIAITPSRSHSAGRVIRQGKIGEDEDSDGESKHRTCVRCMQGVCGGLGTRRPSNQEAFGKGLEGAAQRFIILMIRPPVQDVCTLVRLNFV